MHEANGVDQPGTAALLSSELRLVARLPSTRKGATA